MLPGLIAGFSLLHSSHVAPFFPQKSIWFPRDTALFLHLLEAVDDSWWSRSVGDNPVKVEFMSVLGAARKASVSLKPNPEKAITNLIFWWCSNNWSQDTDIRPSGVSPVTSERLQTALPSAPESPGHDFAHLLPKIFWKLAALLIL